jgi:hypothetical protein
MLDDLDEMPNVEEAGPLWKGKGKADEQFEFDMVRLSIAILWIDWSANIFRRSRAFHLKGFRSLSSDSQPTSLPSSPD